VELNLCPSCNAFVNATWESCGACGAVLREPVVEYAAPPVSEPVVEPPVQPVVEPVAPLAAVTGFDADTFATQWASFGESVNTEPDPAPEPSPPPVETTNTWAAPIEPASTVSTTASWTPPAEPLTQHTEEPPVQISWPTPATSAPERAVAAAPEALSSPSFYAEPAAEPRGLVAEESLQTFHYDAAMVSGRASSYNDGRLSPALGKGTIIGFAAAGIVALLLYMVIVAVVASRADDDALVNVSGPPIETTTTTVAPLETPPSASGGWISYTDPNGYFSGSLPTEPSVSRTTTADGPLVTWVSQNVETKTTVVIVAGALPAGNWTNNQQVLKNALNGAASSSGMSIKGQYTDNDGGVLHLDALLSNSTASSNMRFFVHQNTLYGLSTSGPSSDSNAKAFDLLTKSFEPLNGKKV
jgi:hypothetical protein